jgi:hypothetical protein
VNDDTGITYPRSGSFISAPNAAVEVRGIRGRLNRGIYIPGLEGKDTTGERSTTETVLSVPHAQPHNHVRSDFMVNIETGCISTGEAKVKNSNAWM